jgi:putative radical SAM enzyme (TIGR03279 family)
MNNTKIKKHRICGVEIGSISEKMGIKAGDFLITLNGTPVEDLFDYKILLSNSRISIGVENANGERTVHTIHKGEYADIGLEFENDLMDQPHRCNNHCVFCFIDQLPSSLRESLYFKDDDLRLSFLSGNYVSLTNIDDAKLDRLISYRLSPMNISVHATNPELRIRMMKNPKAGRIMEQLRHITSSGIDVNCQIVVCPGINDGKDLEQTLHQLSDLGNHLQSVAVVPVGLTKFRTKNRLDPLIPFDRESARSVVAIVKVFQKRFLSRENQRTVYAADEFFVKAQLPIPSVRHYEDFPQLENGVGMIAMFIQQMDMGIRKRLRKIEKNTLSGSVKDGIPPSEYGKVLLVTGVDAAAYLRRYEAPLSKIYNRQFITKAIRNNFFGETITVAGLTTGNDIAKILLEDEDLKSAVLVVIPKSMLRKGEFIFLDDVSIEQLGKKLGKEILCVTPNADAFLSELDVAFISRFPEQTLKKGKERICQSHW